MSKVKLQPMPVFDVSPVAMSLYSIKDKKLYDVNRAWLKLFGYTYRKEVLGKTPEEYGLKRDCRLQEHILELTLKKIDPGKVETRVTTRDGRELTLLITASRTMIYGTDSILSIVEDISDLKMKEKALAENESKFRRIVETANEGIWQTDSELRTTYVNRKMAEMLGYTVEEMTGRHIFDFMDEEGRKFLLMKSVKSCETKKTYGHKYLRKDGSYLHALVSATPLYDSTGNYDGSIGMLTDISVRIDIEKTLRKTRRKLEIALENGRIGTWEWNMKTGDIIMDDRMRAMFNIKGSHVLNMEAFENFIHEEDLMHLREAVRQSVKINQPLETIFRTRSQNGHANYISLKGFISKDRKGNPSMLTGVCFDVTEMKKDAEQGIIRLNEELLRSNNDLKQFAYIASHDLQEPLRMVSSFTQLLKQRYNDKLDDDGKEYIRYAVDGSKRMYDLLNGLLTYSRVNTRGKEFSRVDMNEVLETVRSNLSLVISETSCTLDNMRLPKIKADESQMIQLLQNLIENGIKFSKGCPRITVNASRSNGYHLFSVRDEGIGIEEQYFERIFRIFQRLHLQDEYKGTGIGLAICRRIAERHGGTIWVSSKPGEGSTFFFTIPNKS